MTRIALCFPGQGSQMPGMADGLADEPLTRRLLAVAQASGFDLGAALLGDAEALRPTEIAQPALLLVEVVLAAAVDPSLRVVGVAGHSVGEYAALVASGALDAEQAMRVVLERGRVMAAMSEGGMLALLGVDEAAAETIAAAARGDDVAVVANHNAPGQVVLSGSAGAMQRAAVIARAQGVRRAIPLNVSGAFHSPLMAEAAERVAAALDTASITAPRVPVVCNVDAAAVTDPGGLRERLVRQLVAPVRWAESIRALVGLGADVLVEVGPGTVLSGLAKRVDPTVHTVAVGSLAEARELGDRLGVLTRG